MIFSNTGKNAYRLIIDLKSVGRIMGDDAGLPKMVEEWSHTVARNDPRQCQALPRAFQTLTTFWSVYSPEQY